jgi:hypothetical protein
MNSANLADHLRPLAVVLFRTFVFTWLAMVAGGAALAVASGYWMPGVSPFARTLLQIFFVLQFITVGFFVAMRSALGAALIGRVRRLQLGRMALNLLMRRVAADEPDDADGDLEVIESSTDRSESATGKSQTSRQLSAAIAAERLMRILDNLAFFGRPRRGGVFRWLRSALLEGVGRIALVRFRRKSRRAERIDLASMEQELEDQIDGLLLWRLRYRFFVWSIGVVAVLIAEVVGLAFLANQLAR